MVLEGAISVLGVLNRDPARIQKVYLRDGIKSKNAGAVLTVAKRAGVPTEILPAEQLNSLFPDMGGTGGGIIAIASSRVFADYKNALETASKAQKKFYTAAAIEGIEDPYNLGYAVRALYTQGIDLLLLQERGLDGEFETIAQRASTGTFSEMNIATFGKAESEKSELIKNFRTHGFTVCCIDKTKNAVPLTSYKFPDRTLFIIGGEKRGISAPLAKSADITVSIPYARPFGHALAAQTAATIIAYEITRQHTAGVVQPL